MPEEKLKGGWGQIPKSPKMYIVYGFLYDYNFSLRICFILLSTAFRYSVVVT